MEKLFVYGTLAPGQPNAHVLGEVEGEWEKGFVWGKLFDEGWGNAMGFPGIRLDPKDQKVEGQIFTSPRLTDLWPVLDDFEGDGYERVTATAFTNGLPEGVMVFIYALKG